MPASPDLVGRPGSRSPRSPRRVGRNGRNKRSHSFWKREGSPPRAGSGSVELRPTRRAEAGGIGANALMAHVSRRNRLAALWAAGRGDAVEAVALRKKLAGAEVATGAERDELARLRAEVEAARRATWREYIACKAAAPGLKPLPEGEEQTLGGRAWQAARDWHGSWAVGAHGNAGSNAPSLRLPRTGWRRSWPGCVLRRRGWLTVGALRSSAASRDHGYIASLSSSISSRTLAMGRGASKQGPSSPSSNNTGSMRETQVRPIVLLPYMHRVWMAVRKQDLRQWSLPLHCGAHDSAATMAIRTAAAVEVAQQQGSKCYDRIEHRNAGESAAASGMPRQGVSARPSSRPPLSGRATSRPGTLPGLDRRHRFPSGGIYL